MRPVRSVTVVCVALSGLIGGALLGCSPSKSSFHWVPSGDAGEAGTSGLAGTGGAGGQPLLEIDDAVTDVLPSAGCGQAPGQMLGVAVRGTIHTMGTKPVDAADTKKGDWSYEREYFVTLPADYVDTRAYALILEGPGCGGTGQNIYPPDFYASGTVTGSGSIIMVGLTPPPNDIGHAAYPGQGCFDDWEGDDSVDWAFYESLYDLLAARLCFDRNRVFASGRDSGGRMADELGCKYAGDATRPIRGVLTRGGGFPPGPQPLPTCTTKPLAGMWVHTVGNSVYLFEGSTRALSRAMQVDGCAQTTYETAELEPFPIDASGAAGLCKRVKGCPPLYPLVICPLPGGNSREDGDAAVRPGFARFIRLFGAGAM